METSPHASAGYAAQLQRILGSKTFRNTEALKRLLDYLVRQSFEPGARELKEYTIGIEAFGKPPDYDPKTDSSVRVQVSKLRQKLDEYYRTEGANDPLVMELPKGHFQLEFHERSSAVLPRNSPPPVLRWVVTAVALVWAIIATTFAVSHRTSHSASERYDNPNVLALWRPFLTSNRPTLISLGTPLFAKISGDFFRNPTINGAHAFAKSEEVKQLERLLHGTALPAYGYTGVGEATAAFELARLFLARQHDLNLVLSSSLTWEDIARNEVIFVGPPKYNLQEADLPVKQDFTIAHGRLENLHPRPGEPSSFSETWTAEQSSPSEGYAMIGRLPGLHGVGHIMVLAATSTEGTRAAVEYVTRPGYAEELTRALMQSAHSIPDYFQVVVHAQFQSQTPIHVEQVTVHILGK